MLAVSARGMWPRGHVLCLDIGHFEEQLFFSEASQENYHEARARMLREGIRVPGSKEDSFFRRFYRIPCVGFYLFGWEHGLVYYYLLEIAEQQLFYICKLSYAWTMSRQI